MQKQQLFRKQFGGILSECSILASAFSPDGTFLASSHSDGQVFIMATQQTTVMFNKKIWSEEGSILQVNSLCWHPSESNNHNLWELIGTCSNGAILYWKPNFLDNFELKNLGKNNIYCTIDYNASGDRFVTAGVLPQVEIYDSDTFQIVQKYDGIHNFHNQKIQKTKFYPKSEKLFYSGSWDSSVKFWDINMPKKAVQMIYGIQIAGDSIDMHQDCQTVVIGGSSPEDGIQIWDLRNAVAPLISIPWLVTEENAMVNTKCTTVKFLPGTNLIVAGCEQDINPGKVFNYNTGQTIQSFSYLEETITCLDIVQFTNQICIGDINGQLQVYDFLNQTTSTQLPQQPSSFHPLSKRKNEANKIVQHILEQKQKGYMLTLPPPPPTEAELLAMQLEEQRLKELQEKLSSSRKKTKTISHHSTVQDLIQDQISDQFKAADEQSIFSQLKSQQDKQTTLKGGFSARTGTYNMGEDQYHELLSEMKSSNKKRLQLQVTQREEQIMADFMKKAELVQILANQEIDSFDNRNQTATFIKEMEQHLKKSDLTNKNLNRATPQILDMEHLTSELYREDSRLERLPVVKGKISNVKILLQKDLMLDGAIVRAVPFSSRHRQENLKSRNSISKRSIAPSVNSLKSSSTIIRNPHPNSSQDYYTMQYQKQMIVEQPDPNDKVAENFCQFWKSPPTARKYSVPPPDLRKLNSGGSSMPDKKIKKKRPSYLPDLNTIPKEVKQRLPDSDFLAKMRAYIVDAHQNENFVKELTSGGLIPETIKSRLERDQMNEKLGESFADLLSRGKKNLLLEQKIRDRQEAEEEIEEEDEEYLDSQNQTFQDNIKNSAQEKQISAIDQPLELTEELIAFEEAIKKGDLMAAVEMAAATKNLVSQSINMQRYNLRAEQDDLKDNKFFKKYTSQYCKQLQEVLDKNYGSIMNIRLKIRDKQVETFDKKILNHVMDKNIFRKKMPEVFLQNYDGSVELESMLKNNFKQVPISVEVRNKLEADARLMSQNKSPKNASSDPLNDPNYVRRLKMANYGRWFIKPAEFTNKVHILNKELQERM